MKIAVVSSEIAVGEIVDGGQGKAVYRLSRALADCGQDVCVVQPGDQSGLQSIDDLRVLGVGFRRPRWHRLVNRISRGQFDVALRAVHFAKSLSRALLELHARWDFDLAHFPNLGGISACFPLTFPHIIRISSDTPSFRLAGSYDNQNSFAMFQQERIEAHAIRRANAVYGPSARVAELVAGRYHRKVEVMRPPVFPDTTRRDDSALRERIGKGPYLLFYGRLNRHKGLPVLAEILEQLFEKNPGLRIVIIGREHAGYQGMSMRDYLRMKAGLHHQRLIFMEPLSHEQLYPIVEHAVGVILPSLLDNLPNAGLESMMLGKIIITTESSGLDELITDGVNGLLCRPGDPAELLRAVVGCLQMPEDTRNEVGQAARRTILELRPEKTIPPLLDMFTRVLQEHRSGRPS